MYRVMMQLFQKNDAGAADISLLLDSTIDNETSAHTIGQRLATKIATCLPGTWRVRSVYVEDQEKEAKLLKT